MRETKLKKILDWALKTQHGHAAAEVLAIMDPGLLGRFAAEEHNVWSHWMKWLLSEACGHANPDGSFTIFPEKVQRWVRQMNTAYSDLSEDEKVSDQRVVQEHHPGTLHYLYTLEKQPMLSDKIVIGKDVRIGPPQCPNCGSPVEDKVHRRICTKCTWSVDLKEIGVKAPIYTGIEGFCKCLGTTMRECIDCGCMTPGGPTRCKRCAEKVGQDE